MLRNLLLVALVLILSTSALASSKDKLSPQEVVRLFGVVVNVLKDHSERLDALETKVGAKPDTTNLYRGRKPAITEGLPD